MTQVLYKLAYLATSAIALIASGGHQCPSCGAQESFDVSSKFLVTTLRRCNQCQLLFRSPIDRNDKASRFYNRGYQSGFTTELPSHEALLGYLEAGFTGTPKNFNRYIELFDVLGVSEGARVLDLGCSWGYGAWQFQQAGYEVTGLEVGAARANYAREKLGIDTATSLEHIQGTFDVIFSSHVLEHIAELDDVLLWCEQRLSSGGLFVAVTPNGSDSFRRRSPKQWNRLWGAVHPLFLDEVFWQKQCSSKSFLITSNLGDTDTLRRWSKARGQTTGPLDGWELLVIYRNDSPLHSAV
jgi:2-polyprenyl-3-methyl-5-hydroxy-6-metoxy-1,4-benzoquinol methylase